MRLWLEPSDVWLFRDARPFAAGDNHRAESRFPPHPTTIQGAIRTRLLLDSSVPVADYRARQPAELVDVIGPPGGSPPFRLRGPLLARRRGNQVETLQPVPADLVREKGGHCYHYLRPAAQPELGANWPGDLRWLLAPTRARLEEVEGWLTPAQWELYLKQDPALLGDLSDPASGLLRACHLFVREPRVGIALSRQTRRPEEGMLFEIEYVRPREGVGLLVEVTPDTDRVREALAASFGGPGGEGWLTLGGERRLARWTVLEETTRPARPAHRRFRVVLATPALFDAGWRPEAGWSGVFGGTEVHLRAAAIGRPESISGWDVAHNRPRAARPAVPAGSVYFFESDEPVQFEHPFTERQAELGYGHCAIGEWHE